MKGDDGLRIKDKEEERILILTTTLKTPLRSHESLEHTTNTDLLHNIIDTLKMLCSWQATTITHAGGDPYPSLRYFLLVKGKQRTQRGRTGRGGGRGVEGLTEMYEEGGR